MALDSWGTMPREEALFHWFGGPSRITSPTRRSQPAFRLADQPPS